MSVLIRAGILALGAVLLIPSGSARGEAAPQETLLLVVEAPSAKETITVLRDGDAQEEDFETYLTQVVLSEMPADFATEALKAQAVAARTFARRQMAGGKHADADVCSQSACCQACLSADALQERYGAAFDAAWDKASNAVQQTQDEVLTYGGALIDAEALLTGIKQRKIGAACLDVYEEESDIFFEDFSGHIIEDDTLARLISMPNVIVTSHQAFLTEEALANIAETTVRNLLDFQAGTVGANEVCYRCAK